MKLITVSADIAKAILSIQRRGTLLDADIHIAACSVIQHHATHGDSTLADKLVLAMPKGARKLALVEFILAYSQMSKLDAGNDKEAIKAGHIFKTDRTKTLDMDSAIATSWTEFKKEQDVMTAFDAQAAVRSVLARLTKAGADGLSIENKALALQEAQALVLALS